jgi:hypothetical protein
VYDTGKSGLYGHCFYDDRIVVLGFGDGTIQVAHSLCCAPSTCHGCSSCVELALHCLLPPLAVRLHHALLRCRACRLEMFDEPGAFTSQRMHTNQPLVTFEFNTGAGTNVITHSATMLTLVPLVCVCR